MTTSPTNFATTSTDSVAPTLITQMSPDQVSDAIKAAGCAVTAIEQDGRVFLHSASHGVGFQVLWGTSVAPGQYADLTLSCPLRVQGGSLPADVLADWHRSKRFARVALHGEFVVLEMDLLVAGGVTPQHLAMSLQLWTQMMGQFFLHLRNFKPVATADAAASTPAPAVERSEETADSV